MVSKLFTLFVTVDIQDIEGETVALTAEGAKIAGTVRASRWLPSASRARG